MAGKKILGAALGSCVHVSGLYHFLKLAEAAGYETELLGPAVSPRRLVEAIAERRPDIVAVSYRLTPAVAEGLFAELAERVRQGGPSTLRFVFGGTPPVAEVARDSGLFERVFAGTESTDQVRAWLADAGERKGEESFPGTLLERIRQKHPYPLLRHHFGRPTLADTVSGTEEIASAAVLDVLSLGPDQNAQEHFFHPSDMDPAQSGAGGVPLRQPADLEAIFAASRCGNFPLLRCYSGTRDLIRWAEMSVRTIRNAWGAIPLCWYNQIDGRSRRPLAEAAEENQQAMRWYAERGIPVEVNESHQWSLRDAHDALAVCMAFLAAHNAKAMGVRHYVSQLMFNTPPGTAPVMDIAKMMAKSEMIDSLADGTFSVYRQVRAGLAHFSAQPDVAKGQLVASAVTSLALKPHILHVVGFSEGDHAAFPQEVIESCRLVHGALRDCLHGMPEASRDPRVQERKQHLLAEARILLQAIRDLGAGASPDPWSDPRVLAEAVRRGILDTPHFRGHPLARGAVSTRLINGGWEAVDPETGEVLLEAERLQRIQGGG